MSTTTRVILTGALLVTACRPEGAAGPGVHSGEELTEQQPVPVPEASPEAPRRMRVAGMGGLDLWTQVRFEELPDEPHRLQTLFAFPDRTRWMLAPQNNPLGQVRIVYEDGESLFLQEPGSSESIALIGDGLRDQRRNLALRRALFVPEAFEWESPEPEVRRAELGDAGRIELHGPEDRPQTALSFTTSGEDSFQITDVVWPKDKGADERLWPASWNLQHAGQLLWSEERKRCSIQDAVYRHSFIPRDQREPATPQPQPPQLGKRPGQWVYEVPLGSEYSWEDAEVAAAFALQSQREEDLPVEEPVAFTLRADGRPGQVRLTLPEEAGPLPAPWRQDRGRSVVEMIWTTSELPRPAALREAVARIAEKARAEDWELLGSARLLRQEETLLLVQDIRLPSGN